MPNKKIIRLTDIQELVRKNQPDADLERINVAYVLAAKKHFGQLRQSGEPYLYHPLTDCRSSAKRVFHAWQGQTGL